MKKNDLEFLIITGMSGAGKTQAMNFFEDRGYFCIDNLPAALLSNFISLYFKSKGKIKKLAFVIDIRSWGFFEDFFDEIKNLRNNNINYKILFLDAKDEVLLNRFKLTRRKHPLEIYNTLLKNIEEERKRLEDLRNMASIIIDTSNLTIKDLSEKLEDEFKGEFTKNLSITFISFGFKYGIPIDLDMMYDVRFLPNPFYIESLKRKTGNDLEVQEYVMKAEESREFFYKLQDMISFLIPYFEKERKSHLNIGIGCTGGKHRSVTFVNKLYDYFSGFGKSQIRISHRDINK